MKKNVWLVLLVLLLLSGTVFASDYQPRPGVLSPDEVDFGGKTVNILIRDVTWVISNGGKPDTERAAEAEELFNVKISAEEFGAYEQLVSRVMAGDAGYDIFRFNHRSGYFPMVSGGMLYPMSDILPPEYFEALPRADQIAIDTLAWQGKYYAFGVMHGIFNASMNIVAYDYEPLELAGLEDPYELWLQGNWDYKVFEEYLVALTQDTDGDGAIDQYGMYDPGTGIAGIVRFLAGFAKVEFAQKDETGNWVFAHNRNKLINGLNLLHHWRNELQVAGSPSVFNTSHLAGLRNRIAQGDTDYGIVPYPIGPDEDSHSFWTFDYSSNYLPVNSAYPEGMIALVDFLFREEDSEEYLDFYINNYMVSRDHMNVYQAGVDSWAGEGDAFQNAGFWDVISEVMGQVSGGEKGAAAAIDEVAPEAQAWLNDLFGL